MVQMSVHSPRTLRCPRNKNWRNPRPCLICPNTGSTVSFRMAYSRRPRFVRSVGRMRSATESACGIRPRGAAGRGCRWC